MRVCLLSSNDAHAAGPKMRKWYGQQERLPRDGGLEPQVIQCC